MSIRRPWLWWCCRVRNPTRTRRAASLEQRILDLRNWLRFSSNTGSHTWLWSLQLSIGSRSGCVVRKKDRSLRNLLYEPIFMMQSAEYGSLHNPVPTRQTVSALVRGSLLRRDHAVQGLTPNAGSPGYSELSNPESSFAEGVRLRESTSRDTPDEGVRPAARIPSSPSAAIAPTSAELVHPGWRDPCRLSQRRSYPDHG
jgi:hypothetical protein